MLGCSCQMFFLSFLKFRSMVSRSLSWPLTEYEDEDALELLFLLPRRSKWKDHWLLCHSTLFTWCWGVKSGLCECYMRILPVVPFICSCQILPWMETNFSDLLQISFSLMNKQVKLFVMYGQNTLLPMFLSQRQHAHYSPLITISVLSSSSCQNLMISFYNLSLKEPM